MIEDIAFCVKTGETIGMSCFLRPQPGGVDLAIRLQPRSAKDEIVGLIGNELKIKVTAPPVDDAANHALIELLAEKLNCSRGAIRIVRGKTSRHKAVRILGVTAETILHLLLPNSARGMHSSQIS